MVHIPLVSVGNLSRKELDLYAVNEYGELGDRTEGEVAGKRVPKTHFDYSFKFIPSRHRRGYVTLVMVGNNKHGKREIWNGRRLFLKNECELSDDIIEIIIRAAQTVVPPGHELIILEEIAKSYDNPGWDRFNPHCSSTKQWRRQFGLCEHFVEYQVVKAAKIAALVREKLTLTKKQQPPERKGNRYGKHGLKHTTLGEELQKALANI